MLSPSQHPLEIVGLSKSFDKTPALKALNLTLAEGQVLALLGPSGCGKTTLLRCIAGLLAPDTGVIYMGGQRVAEGSFSLPPEQRRLGMVFQDYALWPHMTVTENLAFPLKMQRINADDRQQRIRWALELVGLGAMAKRSPGTLSGGQQQRVALARAIVAQPRLLLMDEPLSNLDKGLREQLALDIRELIDSLGLTAVFVTHDQQEAFALADQVAVLQQGVIAQLAAPEDLYRAPATAAIAEFLDAGTLVSAKCTLESLYLAGQPLSIKPVVPYTGSATLLLPRSALKLDAAGALTGRVYGRVYQGEGYGVQVQLAEGPRVKLRLPECPPLGSDVNLALDVTQIRAWDDDKQPLALSACDDETTFAV